MDFVVFGFGLGAILMLVGFALRDLGPWLFGSARAEESLPEFEGARTTVRKQTLSSIGNAISVGGAGIAIVTFSALLAKTDDDLGSIVVGMSLVLATLGVAAWTYDVFRRYRAAMEIIATQESAARERLAPRAKRRRPRPDPAAPPTEQPAQPTAPEPTPEKRDLPLAAESSPESEASGALGELRSEPEPIEAVPIVPLPQGSTSNVESDNGQTTAPQVRRSAEAEPDRSYQGEPPFANPDAVEPVLAAPSSVNDPGSDPDHVELPPLPDDADDALIDEAVRLEPRTEPKRAVPSWLFEDLETDLATNSPIRQDDPVDQFQEAKPVARRSALERLLSNDPVPESEPPEDDQRRQQGGRQAPRNGG